MKNNIIEFIEKFKNFLITEKMFSVNTIDAYYKDLNDFYNFLKKRKKIDDINKLNNLAAREFIQFIKQNNSLGARSVARKISTLKSFSNYLNSQHGIPIFTTNLIFPKLPKRLPKSCSEFQLEKLFEFIIKDTSVLGYRNKLMIYLVYSCGIRVSELVNLKISDIDFEMLQIKIFGKGGKERNIPLNKKIFNSLQHYLETIHPILTEGKYNIFLFPVRYKQIIKPLSRQSFWLILKNCSKEALGGKSISPHILRHSIATHLLKSGVNLRLLQELLGHQKLNTISIYTSIELSRLREVYNMFHPRA